MGLPRGVYPERTFFDRLRMSGRVMEKWRRVDNDGGFFAVLRMTGWLRMTCRLMRFGRWHLGLWIYLGFGALNLALV